jgi:6-phosphogluconolactonase (cycloisomerase 2 family)
MKRVLLISICFLLVITTFISCRKDEHDDDSFEDKFLYVLTNNVDSNAVLTYERNNTDGSLTYLSKTFTGGKGTGLPLMSQGPISISNNKKWILAVNAGNNIISAFKITDDGLQLTSTISSNGNKPVSVTCFNNLVYVVNANDNGNISGYNLSDYGILTPIQNGVVPLDTTATNPAQISFLPDGKMLAITLKTTNKIIAYKLNDNGTLGEKFSLSSNSPRPYGFAIGQQGNIYVSEAAQSAMSVYNITSTGINSVAGPLLTNQISACWAATTPNGKYIYIVNANSNSVTGYNINSSTSFTIMQPNGITAMTGIKPLDIAISENSMFAYILNYDDQSIRVFNVTPTGGLEKTEDKFNLPVGSVGIALK